MSERVIQRLLGIEREVTRVKGAGVEAEADWDHLRTPETYLGYQRGERFASPGGATLGERRVYELPARLGVNAWALAGDGHGVLEGGRLYNLVRERDAVRERTLEIAFFDAGAEAGAFTFG